MFEKGMINPIEIMKQTTIELDLFNFGDGVTFLPNALFDHYSTLGLTPSELVVYINIWRHWTNPNTLPCPSNRVISKSTGFRPRTVNWYTAKLHELGFIERIERRCTNGSNMTNQYNLSPLITYLEKIAKPMSVLESYPSDGDCEIRKEIGCRYGDSLSIFGSTIIPNMLLDRQSDLGITQSELFLIFNLMRHMYSNKPILNVTLRQLSVQMGMNKRTISALVTKLVKKGFLKRYTRINASNEYDIHPLLLALRNGIFEITDGERSMDAKSYIDKVNDNSLWHRLLTSESLAL
ncbi:helix-turn-helix domain-containing protein [Vibrio sp. Hal054]|uniref:helix-turn-helix domain-containing protein n=1 Tax=Vibrio sp. Hal054 TaxID=3035158 RepID=UPI00301D5473